MGLDIYAGPLSRYYSGAWRTAVQQWADSQGMRHVVIRPGQRGLRGLWDRMLSTLRRKADPVALVSEWRDRLAADGRFAGAADWQWPEAVDLDYDTDKPDFDGYGAVQLWAAYCERRHVARPVEFSPGWAEDPVFTEVSRSPKDFDHILGPELWLPVVFDDAFEGPEPNGNLLRTGSVFRLLEQLRRLNRESWNASEDAIREWRKEAFDPEKLDSIARWSFSIWYRLAEFAAEHRAPMRLDC
jgi:hypothetical protein